VWTEFHTNLCDFHTEFVWSIVKKQKITQTFTQSFCVTISTQSLCETFQFLWCHTNLCVRITCKHLPISTHPIFLNVKLKNRKFRSTNVFKEHSFWFSLVYLRNLVKSRKFWPNTSPLWLENQLHYPKIEFKFKLRYFSLRFVTRRRGVPSQPTGAGSKFGLREYHHASLCNFGIVAGLESRLTAHMSI
jgi:hypothetical protein